MKTYAVTEEKLVNYSLALEKFYTTGTDYLAVVKASMACRAMEVKDGEIKPRAAGEAEEDVGNP
jgi:hypothetical protein